MAAELSDSQNPIEIFRSYIEKGDCRRAYEYVRQEKEAFRESGENPDELLQQARQCSNEIVHAVQEEIETELSRAPKDFDKDKVEELLERWKRAVLDTSDPALQSARRRADRRAEEQKKFLVYESFRKEVNDLLTRAQQDAQANATPETVAARYKEAYEIARNAAAEHPDNERLQTLLADARNKYERASIAREAMTSGALTGQYVATLLFTRTAGDEDYIPIFDQYGKQAATFPKREAEEQAIQAAKAFADRKLGEYMDKARRLLKEERPRAAREALNEYRKFYEPEKILFSEEKRALLGNRSYSLIDLIPDLFSDTRLEELAQLEDRIQGDLAKLENAEKEAQHGSEVVSKKPATAWQHYQSALKIYKGAEHSSVVQKLKGALEKNARSALQTASDDVESAIREKNLEAALQKAEETLALYEPMVEQLPTLGGAVEGLRTHRENILHVRRALDEAQEALDEGDTDTAQTKLRGLTSAPEYRPYYQATERYQTLRDRLAGLQNAFALHSQLASYLESGSPVEVKRALERAEKLVTKSPNADDFADLVRDLSAHLLYLQADRRAKTEGYDKIIAEIEDVLSAKEVKAEILAELENKREELHQRAQELGESQENVQWAQKLFGEKAYAEAYELLENAEEFGTTKERSDRDNLLKKVRKAWARQLQATLRGLSVEKTLDRNEARKTFEQLEELDSQAAEKVRKHYNRCMQAQAAREQSERAIREKNEQLLEDAIQSWDDLLAQAGWEEQKYISQEIDWLNLALKELEVTDVLQNVPAEEEQRDEWLGKVERLRRELPILQKGVRNPWVKIQYGVWLANVLLVLARYTPDAHTRKEALNQLREVGEYIRRQLRRKLRIEHERDEELFQTAKNAVDVAAIASQIESAMQAVEANLNTESDLNLFDQTVRRWREIPDLPLLRTLHEWFGERARAVQKELRQALTASGEGQYTDLTPHTLPLYAKLLLLDSADPYGNWMLKQLPALSATLDHHIQETGSSLFTADGITPQEAKSVLQNKLDEIEEHIQYLRLIDWMADQFSELGILEDQNTITALKNTANQGGKDLEEARNLLKQFTERGEAFLNTIETLEPSSPDSLENFAEETEKLWVEFRRTVQAIDSNLVTHPWTQWIQARLQERKNYLRKLIDHLVAIQKAMEQENFEQAHTHMTMVQNEFAADFASMELAGTYTVYDRWDEQWVSGWNRICKLIQKRKKSFEIIEGWAAPFDPLEEMNIPTEEIPPARAILFWPDAQKEADNLKHNGRFEEAAEVVQKAIGDGRPPQEGFPWSLAYTVDRVTHPPLGDGVGTTPDYVRAKREAGTKRGQVLLEWVERYRMPVYQEWLKKAQDKLQEIREEADQFEKLLEDFSGILRSIVTATREHKRGWKREINKLCRGGEDILSELEQIAPNHPYLETLYNNPVWQKAQQNRR